MPVAALMGEAEWHFYLGGRGVPTLYPGPRCYIVAHGRARGYALVTAIERYHRGFAIVGQRLDADLQRRDAQALVRAKGTRAEGRM